MVSAGPFALFDDGSIASNRSAGGADVSAPTDFVASSSPGSSGGSSRLYTGFVRERVCHDAAQLDAFDVAVAADLAAGLHAVVLADYEWGTALNGVPAVSAASAVSRRVAGSSGEPQHVPGEPQQVSRALDQPLPALRCLMFDTLARPTRGEVDEWLAAHDNRQTEPSCAGVLDLEPSVERAEFDRSLSEIGEALRAGDAYQINYTFRLDFTAYGEPLALYRRLRARQPVRYGALIALPEQRWILSCSPELFVAFDSAATELTARPMKGTAARLSDPQADREAASGLAQDAKNRAENLMIVDLLRNDLGRIAETGSVKTPALFSIEGHPSVWQMTSTVTARLKAGTSFANVMRALFPCGSITGAPKHRAMQIIASLESTPRGLYTGAIGWLDAPLPGAGNACGDFCLSVAIRTLCLQAPHADEMRAGRIGIGAGIVLDSQCDDEYEECYLKARFLTGLDPGLTLFETILASRRQRVPYLDRHLARLANGARRLGFACEPAALRAAVLTQIGELPDEGEYRLRLVLAHDGQASVTHAPLRPLPPGPVKILLAQDLGFAATDATDALLGFKSSRRADYDKAWQQAEALGGFDAIFVNTRGELTEGGRSNLFVKLAGRWWTPPLASGVLPGVMRAVLLEDPQWAATERVLLPKDLDAAEALVVSNALRAAVPAQLIRNLP